MTPARKQTFDPRSILACLERSSVGYIVIGGLARVLRGANEVTTGVDICPSPTNDNLQRLARALADVGARRTDGFELAVTERALDQEPVLELATPFGELKIVLAPAGVPRGFVALRAAASKENLGHRLQPYVASVGDLAAMAAALSRPQDLARLPELRSIMALEVDRVQTIGPPPRGRPRRQTAVGARSSTPRLTP